MPRLRVDDTRLITLTRRHDDLPLREQLTDILQSFNRLRRDPTWKTTQEGAAAFLEVKVGRDGRWHPHLHVLAIGRWVSRAALSDAWRKASRGSWIVHVTRPKDLRHVAHYVTKYVTKPLDSSLFRDPDRLDTAIAALKGRRLVNASGSFGRINADAPDDTGDDDWATVGRLDTLLVDAGQGDRVAAGVLAALFPHADPAREHDRTAGRRESS